MLEPYPEKPFRACSSRLYERKCPRRTQQKTMKTKTISLQICEELALALRYALPFVEDESLAAFGGTDQPEVKRHVAETQVRAALALVGLYPDAPSTGTINPQVVRDLVRKFAGLKIVQNSSGARAVLIAEKIVPVEVLSLLAGSDSWLRKLPIPCKECGRFVLAGNLEAEYCQACFDQFGEENAKADKGGA